MQKSIKGSLIHPWGYPGIWEMDANEHELVVTTLPCIIKSFVSDPVALFLLLASKKQ